MKNACVDYKSIMRWVLMGAGPGKVKPLRQNNGRRRVALWHTLSRLRSRSKSTSAGTLTQTLPPISSPLHTGNKWSSGSLFELGGCIYPEGVIYLLVKYCFISEDEKYYF